jgi:hypothetical protein
MDENLLVKKCRKNVMRKSSAPRFPAKRRISRLYCFSAFLIQIPITIRSRNVFRDSPQAKSRGNLPTSSVRGAPRQSMQEFLFPKRSGNLQGRLDCRVAAPLAMTRAVI